MILVYGTICLDRLLRVPRLPQPGGYVEIVSEEVFLGGEAANTANALASWGVDVKLAGNTAGSGPEGHLLRSLLAKKALTNLSDTVREHGKTPVCDIYVTPDGERTMFGRGFSSMEPAISLDSVPFQAGEWFTAEPNMSTVARDAVRRARRSGMKLYLMDFFREGDPIEPGSYWQCSTDWMGTRGNVQKNVKLIQDWVARYGSFSILSDGPNGFVAGSPSMPVRHYPPFPAPYIVDTTGAGDMFRAGMLFGLENDWPIAACLAYAAASGSLACASLGATQRVPTRTEIETLMRSQPEILQLYGITALPEQSRVGSGNFNG